MKIFFYSIIFFFLALIIIHFIQTKDREYFKCNLDDNKGSHDCFKEKQNDNSQKLKESSKKSSKLEKAVSNLRDKAKENKKESKKISDYLKSVKEEGTVDE